MAFLRSRFLIDVDVLLSEGEPPHIRLFISTWAVALCIHSTYSLPKYLLLNIFIPFI